MRPGSSGNVGAERDKLELYELRQRVGDAGVPYGGPPCQGLGDASFLDKAASRRAGTVCHVDPEVGMVGVRAGARRGFPTEEETVILATTKVEDFDRFVKVFSTKGAAKREQHGSKGSHVFRDPNEDDRVWVLFDWDAEGWQKFVSDPEVPAILQEAGHKGRPQAAELGGQYGA